MSEFSFISSKVDVESGSSFIPTRHDDEEDVFIIDTLILSESVDVFWERDVDEDGEFEISVKLDSLSSGISSNNSIPVNEYKNSRVRIVNTGSGVGDFTVMGDLL
ncbi:hypothetical protein [Natrinema sp. DC36]|uniref:hypothetical protein n=1 Tax=Natrinema sp. DC36 TaxID=2878680 RepID=UPI001CEFDA4B|nr:hypothetical protein [Natrinema sp. DC36]